MRIFCYCLLGLLSLNAFSKPDVQAQPIQFSAGQVEWDQLSSKGVFSDNVLFIQGSTKITAASGYAIGDTTHQFKKVVLLGTEKVQASFKTMPKENDPEVQAYADKMIYLPLEEMIKLIGHVKINQGRYHFQAPYLEYHLATKKIISKSTDKNMTTIIIEPENNEKHT